VDIMAFFTQSRCANNFDKLVCCMRDTFLASWRFGSRCSIRGRTCLVLAQLQATFCTYYNRRPFFESKLLRPPLFCCSDQLQKSKLLSQLKSTPFLITIELLISSINYINSDYDDFKLPVAYRFLQFCLLLNFKI
jgi:hypothetical protein